jgi:hypothetical protein
MLGPLEVRTDGDPGEVVEVAGPRVRALLIVLALHPGQLVGPRRPNTEPVRTARPIPSSATVSPLL